MVVVQREKNVNIYEMGDQVLPLAALRGDDKRVRELLEGGVVGDIDVRNKYGNTALMLAVINGKCACAKTLVDAGADMALSNHYGENSLTIAAHFGHAACLEILLRTGTEVDRTNAKGDSPLALAASNGHIGCMKLLLQHEANINIQDGRGMSPLMLSLQTRPSQCAATLIQAGADVDVRNHDSHTALMIAAIRGDEESVEMLLKAGANPEITDENGCTAFMLAAQNGQVGPLQVLATSSSKYAGTSPILAQNRCVYQTASVDLNAKNKDGDTALVMAAKHIECMELLVQLGADVRSIMGSNSSGATYACSRSKCRQYIVQTLLARVPGCVNDEWKALKDMNLLHFFISIGSVHMVKYLLGNGADARSGSRDKCTPLTRLLSIEPIFHENDFGETCPKRLSTKMAEDRVDNLLSLLLKAGADPTQAGYTHDHSLCMSPMELALQYTPKNEEGVVHARTRARMLWLVGASVPRALSISGHDDLHPCDTSEPRPLQQTCRIVIRKTLGGIHLQDKIRSLHCPKILQHFLLLHELDEYN